MKITPHRLYRTIYKWTKEYNIIRNYSYILRTNNSIQFMYSKHKAGNNVVVNIYNDNDNIFNYCGYDYHYLDLLYNILYTEK